MNQFNSSILLASSRIDVSQDDCKKIMSGDRPFNYFQEQQNGISTQNNFSANSTQASQQNTQQTNAKMTTEQYAKYLQYLEDNNQAQNYVQDNIRHNPINGAHAL
ncbi:hypothetical protein [Acinetobacter soli]|uniref:hypothetical protein n=1 Tax=Acinetobacter soli TaxID=487316 RepID=UPI001C09CBD3|nr:hypothetical protein [Acinetobacter soli]